VVDRLRKKMSSRPRTTASVPYPGPTWTSSQSFVGVTPDAPEALEASPAGAAPGAASTLLIRLRLAMSTMPACAPAASQARS